MLDNKEKSLRPEAELDHRPPPAEAHEHDAETHEEHPTMRARLAHLWSRRHRSKAMPLYRSPTAGEVTPMEAGAAAEHAGPAKIWAQHDAHADAPIEADADADIGHEAAPIEVAEHEPEVTEEHGAEHAPAEHAGHARRAPARRRRPKTSNAPSVRQAHPPSAAGQAEAMEMFREVNGDAPATATAAPSSAGLTHPPGIAPTIAHPPGIGHAPSAAGQAEAMELFREVNGDAPATATTPMATPATAGIAQPGIAPAIAPAGVGHAPSAAGRAEAMELFREVNADVPTTATPAIAPVTPATAPVAATPATAGIGKPPVAATPATAGIGKPPSAAGQTEAMELFREVNGDVAPTATSTTAPPTATPAGLAAPAHGAAPAGAVAPTGATAHTQPGVPARVTDLQTQLQAAHQIQHPAIERHDLPLAHEQVHAPGEVAHELAHAKQADPHASTAAIERPGLGKPSEIGENVAGMDPRGELRPDVGDQVNAIHQLAQPLDQAPTEDTLQELSHEGAHANQLGLDQVHDAHQLDTQVKTAETQIHTAHDTKLNKAIEHHEGLHRKAASHAGQQRQQVAHKGQQSVQRHRQSVTQAKAHKHLSKDELKLKLTTAADAKRTQLETSFTTKQAELDTKLKAQLAKAQTDLEQSNKKLTAQADAQAKTLEANIAKRKAAHDAEIAKKRPALEAQGQKEQDTLKAKAKTDADGIKAEALHQADLTTANAETRAKETEAKGETEAKHAISDGDSQAKKATDAAEARAKALTDSGEASHVRGEGKTRADMAHAQATKRADELRAQGKAEAQKLRDKGKADHDAQIAKGDVRAAEAITNGNAAAAKVNQATLDAIAKMQAESDAAVAKMNAEVTQMRAELEVKRATMNANGVKAISDAAAKIDADRTKALADMQAAHDKAKKTIDDSVAKDVDKIDKANDKDLAKLEREVDADIQKIDAATTQATTSIDRSVASAEQKAAVQVNRAKATIDADRSRALFSLQQSAAAARQRITADDKETKKKIDGAAQQGTKDIAAASAQATTDLATANGKLLDQTKADGDARRAEADKQAAGAGKAMEDSEKKLNGEISKAWVDDAVSKAHKKMERSWDDWAVTDSEATEAMNDLNSLPADEQGQAVKQLDGDDFHKLLNEVPDERREEFKSLVDNTHDPERKLQLWGEYHKSHVENDAKKEAAKTSDTGWWPFESKEQDKNRHLNKIRNETVSATKDEVSDEIKFLEEKQKAGTLTEADVLALETRKEKEHQIEQKYGVNLVNKEGKRADGTKIAWTAAELDQVDSALGRVPQSAVKDNEMLKKIVRSDQSEGEDDPKNPVIGGDHSGGVIRIFDVGTTPGFRIDGMNRQLADPSVAPGISPQLGSIEVSLDHELGHDMHDQNPDAFKKFQQAAGWQKDVGDDQMKTQGGLSEADIKKLKDASKAHKHLELVGKDGKVYENDPYSRGDIIAYDKDALATSADAQPGVTTTDTWSYGRSNPKDDFAEQYTKAVHTPESLAKDMIDAPKNRVNAANTQSAADQAALAAEKAKSPGDPAAISVLEQKVKKSQTEVDAANKEQTARKTQYDVMRNDIFHTDVETEAAAKRLAAKGVDPTKIAEFRDKAARASTPQQIQVIESGY